LSLLVFKFNFPNGQNRDGTLKRRYLTDDTDTIKFSAKLSFFQLLKSKEFNFEAFLVDLLSVGRRTCVEPKSIVFVPIRLPTEAAQI
jgi:hypothetical protein